MRTVAATSCRTSLSCTQQSDAVPAGAGSSKSAAGRPPAAVAAVAEATARGGLGDSCSSLRRLAALLLRMRGGSAIPDYVSSGAGKVCISETLPSERGADYYVVLLQLLRETTGAAQFFDHAWHPLCVLLLAPLGLRSSPYGRQFRLGSCVGAIPGARARARRRQRGAADTGTEPQRVEGCCCHAAAAFQRRTIRIQGPRRRQGERAHRLSLACRPLWEPPLFLNASFGSSSGFRWLSGWFVRALAPRRPSSRPFRCSHAAGRRRQGW